LAQENILQAVKISKAYPGVQALDDVDFILGHGEVQALVGQNGAGKSTFIEILSGSLRPDSGEIVFKGQTFQYLGPSMSIELGIQTVHQDNQLVEELSVAENIYLYNLPRNRIGIVDYAKCEKQADSLLLDLGIQLATDRKMTQLTFIEKKLVSIAKACSRQAQVLILDEPTASLDENGKNILFDIIRQNAKKGMGIIYISHNLHEIFEICDSVTVFKDGQKVATHKVADINMNTIVQEMIGRSTTSFYNRQRRTTLGEEKDILEVKDYSREGVVKNVSFSVRKGEIFGLGGLVGAGRTELARMIFGLDPKDSGNLVYCDKDCTPANPFDAIQKGIGYLTEDRKDNGLFLDRPIFENVSLVRLAKGVNLVMDLKKERRETGEISKQIDIKTPSIDQLVINLSGGNQQKVVLAKWLFAGSEVLIFDEPTVGVDVGAKDEIYRMMENLANQGKVIIMISSDNPELVAICDRVGIMRNQGLVTILEGDEITEESILRYSLGVDEKE
jgi:ribose transport system ATP-binding protein